MLGLRFAALLAVAVWVGGLLALGGIAAPAIFDLIGAQRIPDGRVLAGAVFGEILRRFHMVAYGCAGVILTVLVARAVLGPRPRRFAVRVAITIVMLATTLYSGFVVSGRIDRLRDEIGAAPSSLPVSDPRRASFGQLHAQSTALQLVPLVGGLILMLLELRD